MSLKFTDLKQDGYERVLLAEEHVTGFYSIIAIHNTKRGPALGGCRFFWLPR
jgi:leucine dehydrogenase